MLSTRLNCLSQFYVYILWIFINLFAVDPILHSFPAANPSVTSLVKMIAQIYLDLPEKIVCVLHMLNLSYCPLQGEDFSCYAQYIYISLILYYQPSI